jgi:hypothetical protein
MSDEPKKRSWPWPVRLAWTAVALLMLYPLSAGPAWWAAQHLASCGWDDAWTVDEQVYAPLYVAIARTTPSLFDPFERYVRFFDVDPQK